EEQARGGRAAAEIVDVERRRRQELQRRQEDGEAERAHHEKARREQTIARSVGHCRAMSTPCTRSVRTFAAHVDSSTSPTPTSPSDRPIQRPTTTQPPWKQ